MKSFNPLMDLYAQSSCKGIKAKWFILGLGGAAVAGLTGCDTSEDDKPEQPNIIYIMADDHAYQALSCYSGELIQTPNLDQIAEEGVQFTNSFVTNSISAPSRAVLLTGKHSHLNGVIDNREPFDSTQVTFPKLLKDAGYQTAMIGKWHLKTQPTGFDFWKVLPGQGDYYNPVFIENGKRVKEEGHSTNLITNFGLNWLKQRDKDKPFSMMVHFKAPHRNWMPDTTEFDRFDDTKFPVPSNFFDDYEGRKAAQEQEMSIWKDMRLVWDLKLLDDEGEIENGRGGFKSKINRMNPAQRKAWNEEYDPRINDFKNANLEGKELARWKYQKYLTDYLRTIAGIDRNVGRIMEYLKEQGLAENTLIIYASDQGFYLGEHGWFDKRFMYNESLRTPLIMRPPKGYTARGEIDEMVQNIDYAPTMLDIAGVEIPEDMQGRSMVPLLKGKDTEWRDKLYYHYYEYPGAHSVKRHYGIRTERYKLMHFYYDIDTWELYDLKKDPKEMNNLYGKEGYDEITRRLKEQLEELRDKYKVPEKDPYLPESE
ncbi:MAG: sulfatase [Bacteroidales bacterium]